MDPETSGSTPDDHIYDGTFDAIFRLLSTVYWDGLEREIRELILAYQDIETYQPNYPDESSAPDLSACNFKRFCTLLTPYVKGDDAFDSVRLHSRAVELAQAHLGLDSKSRRSRHLLQTLGLLDVDVVHDGMDDVTIGRHCHNPRGETFRLPNQSHFYFREMRCEACQQPLREYFYYECNEGCVSSIPNFYIQDQENNDIEAPDLPLASQPPVRLCVACTRKDNKLATCKREHCRKIFHPKVEDKGMASFRAKLRTFEFREKDGPSRKSNGSSESQLKRTASKLISPTHFANAGLLHVALTFGPLMIENGVPHVYKSDISCRPIPSLRYKPSLMKMIFSERDATDETVLIGHVYDDRANKRVIKELHQKPRTDRRILGCAKKVCGGALSGHNVHLADGEKDVIRRLVEAGSSFKIKGKSTDWVTQARSNLRKASLPIVEAIKETFEHEINIYLKHFSKVLSNPDTRLSWDWRDNNCQTFATNLIKDLRIYGTFHHMPLAFIDDENVRNAKDWSCPRYAMSFGSSIDTPIALLRPQPRSLIWNFYHRHRDNCDIVEFGEIYRRKPCAFPTEAWLLLDGIEDTGEAKISLVDALWSIPRDSVSILHTHLLRDSSVYSSTEQKVLTREQWVQNRLRVMHQLDVFASLSGALTAALMEQRIEKRHLIAKSAHPLAEDYGDFHAEERMKIFDVGGRFIYSVSGRERNWHKAEWMHLFRKLKNGEQVHKNS